MFSTLPYEVIIQIMANLNGRDIQQFIQCNSAIYHRSEQESFWFELCRLNGIYYCHPEMTYKELFCSGELCKMCPHLNKKILNVSVIQHKKQLLWSSFHQNITNGNAVHSHILCLHPSCDFFGEENDHQNHAIENKKHNIILKLSPSHTLELWCNCCVKAIGFDGFAPHVEKGLKSEKFIMIEITKSLASVSIDNQQLASHITRGRQEIESNILRFQFRQSTMHVVEKSWHNAWLDFISGKSNNLPGCLTNEKLLRSDGTLDPTLSLGKDFEVIGNLTRWYIERIYGVVGAIISSNDLQNVPEYCKLVHSIRIRQQINQAARYPSAFFAAS